MLTRKTVKQGIEDGQTELCGNLYWNDMMPVYLETEEERLAIRKKEWKLQKRHRLTCKNVNEMVQVPGWFKYEHKYSDLESAYDPETQQVMSDGQVEWRTNMFVYNETEEDWKRVFAKEKESRE